MSSVDLITSPPLSSPVRSPVIVVDSDDEEGPVPKRRRQSNDSEGSSDDVIDLTEGGDESNASHIHFKILPKLIKLSPFTFSEDNDEEHDGVPLASLREHLRRLFGNNGINNLHSGNNTTLTTDPPSSDEIEITGVKEPSIYSLSFNSLPPTDTAISSARSKGKEKDTSTSSSNTNEKENNDGKVSLECPICLGQMKNITATTCGHIFCKDCIRTAIQVTKCCPLCKKKLTIRSIHPLYL